ncbi:MAG TPA: glycerophosphodiester phosphodiesterase family protein [Kiritimatiellia bacterium]|nr:glycerophosphodiester phosphodiesterase family protein [Kiritimatiellia bacterium]
MNTGSGSRYSICSFALLTLLASGGVFHLTCAQAAAVEVAAHRGGYKVFPENTCAAFRSCAGRADRIEFDVRVSADGELVIMHDATVNRTATGFGEITNVADLTLAQLKELDVGIKFSAQYAGERIPTLVEALRALPPGVPAMVHCKTGPAAAIVDVLRAENAISNLCIASGDLNFLSSVYRLEPSVELAYEGAGTLAPRNIVVAQMMHATSFLWYPGSVTPDLVDLVHAAGMRIEVSIATPDFQKYMDMGVDRILADDPRIGKLLAGNEPSSNVQLSRNLFAYWKFDDGLVDPATTNVDDVEDHSPIRLAPSNAAPAWISGADARFGGALLLDGTDDCALVPTNAYLDVGANAVSISLWVKLAARPSDLPANGFACIYDSVLDGYSIYLDRASNELRFKTTDASLQSARPGILSTNLQTGVWHHVVGVYDGSAMPQAGQAMIYLDGRLQDVHTGSDSSVGCGLTNAVRRGQAAAIGQNGPKDGSFFGGAVDDVAIWSRAISPAEIRQIHSAGTNGMPLEKSVMTLWIANVYPDPETGDMVMDVQIDHGSLTNQLLSLRGAPVAGDPYVEQAVLEGHRGHRANFHVSHLNDPGQAPARNSETPAPCFFQIVCP